MLILFPLIALIVVGGLFRDELGLRSIITYAAIWAAALVAVLILNVSPGVFVVLQCFLAVAMLIQVRANPQV